MVLPDSVQKAFIAKMFLTAEISVCRREREFIEMLPAALLDLYVRLISRVLNGVPNFDQPIERQSYSGRCICDCWLCDWQGSVKYH